MKRRCQGLAGFLKLVATWTALTVGREAVRRARTQRRIHIRHIRDNAVENRPVETQRSIGVSKGLKVQNFFYPVKTSTVTPRGLAVRTSSDRIHCSKKDEDDEATEAAVLAAVVAAAVVVVLLLTLSNREIYKVSSWSPRPRP